MPRFEDFIGLLTNITFQDGAELASKKGRVISVDDEFLTFQTRHNSYLIRQSAIISIKTFGNEEGGR